MIPEQNKIVARREAVTRESNLRRLRQMEVEAQKLVPPTYCEGWADFDVRASNIRSLRLAAEVAPTAEEVHFLVLCAESTLARMQEQ